MTVLTDLQKRSKEDDLCYSLPQDLRTESVQKASEFSFREIGLTDTQKQDVHDRFWKVFAILVWMGD